MTYFATEVSHIIRRYFSVYFSPNTMKTKQEVQDHFILYLQRFWTNVRQDVTFNELPNRSIVRPDIVIANSITNEKVPVNFKWIKTKKPFAELWDVIYRNNIILQFDRNVETVYTVLLIQKDEVSSKPEIEDRDRLLYNLTLNRLITLQNVRVKNNRQVNMSVMWLNSADEKYQFCILTQNKQSQNH